MKESYVKGLANHNGPESCVEWRDSPGEALTGVRAGRVLSREINLVRDADPLMRWGRQQSTCRSGKAWRYPARSETPGMHGNNLRENREILRPPRLARLGRIEKSKDVRR
jgi:RNA-directed DNA polymerase